ncbi:hypothetical protein U1Q18_022093, partial [Sarracenia purpurea var. burkii]
MLAVKWWAGPKQVVNLLLRHIGEVEGNRITGGRWRSGRQQRTAEGLTGVVRRLGDAAASNGADGRQQQTAEDPWAPERTMKSSSAMS